MALEPTPRPEAVVPRKADVVTVERVTNGFKLLDIRDGKQWVAITPGDLGALIATIFEEPVP